MEGAPPRGEEDKYWSDLLDELRSFHGADTIDELLGSGSASGCA
jgi:hypothetical protein